MKFIYYLLISLIIIITGGTAFAQNTADVSLLIKQGVQLNNEGKYAEAIEIYNQALKIDTGNLYADYGLGFSLLNLSRGNEGIPYLNKVVKVNNKLTPWAYDLLGSIYDKNHESEKAIAAFNLGIKADPKYQRLYYNLGLVYFRDKQYSEAEKCAIEAIKLDPKHANSQRMYALVTFHQNKRAAALMGFCSFILLEPNTARSAEAFGNIGHILQGGVLKPAPGEKAPQANDANTTALNQAITQAVAETGKKKADLLTAQLTAIFTAIGTLAEKQTGDDFFRKYYAAYFYQLAQSPNMPAFARSISSATNKDEYAKWAADHSKEVADLDNWVKVTERGF
jgi:tetratricopeptide (TPR) repeat protein